MPLQCLPSAALSAHTGISINRTDWPEVTAVRSYTMINDPLVGSLTHGSTKIVVRREILGWNSKDLIFGSLTTFSWGHCAG